MKNIHQENEIEQIAQGLKNIIKTPTPIQWCNNKKMIQTMVTTWKPNMCQYPRQRPSSQPPLPLAQPLNTCSHIATQNQSNYRPYLALNIDVSVEFAQQHASCVDVTIPASIHKSRVSTLPTYNINTSDHHTHPIHTHALHQHTTTATSTTANISDPNTHI